MYSPLSFVYHLNNATEHAPGNTSTGKACTGNHGGKTGRYACMCLADKEKFILIPALFSFAFARGPRMIDKDPCMYDVEKVMMMVMMMCFCGRRRAQNSMYIPQDLSSRRLTTSRVCKRVRSHAPAIGLIATH